MNTDGTQVGSKVYSKHCLWLNGYLANDDDDDDMLLSLDDC